MAGVAGASALGSSLSGLGTALGGGAALLGTIGSFLPSTQTSSFSGATNKQTSRTDFDEDAIKRILALAFAGTDGIQSISAGERTSGIFDSTTNQQLINDLLTRTTGEIARLTAPTEVVQELGPSKTKTKSSKCFITGAVCLNLGLPDDCPELTTLREYRDTWLVEHHPDLITEYYAASPAVVEKINAHPGKKNIYSILYLCYIAPAVAAILHGEPEKALEIYKAMFNAAVEKTTGE